MRAHRIGERHRQIAAAAPNKDDVRIRNPFHSQWRFVVNDGYIRYIKMTGIASDEFAGFGIAVHRVYLTLRGSQRRFH